MATFYLDFEGGNDANNGTSFAQRWKTITSGATAARIAPGDEIRVMASPDATSLGQSATWTDNSAAVTLTTAVTATISDCETAWTAAANVTATADTTNVATGAKSAKFVIASGFTTGLVAYKTTAANLDLSAYQQISFWMQANGAANTIQIKLCSDSAGATPLATLTVPYQTTINDWSPIVIDNGSALPSGINSIAVYVQTTDPGAVTWFFDQFIACKAPSSPDSLTLRSLIGKNNGELEWWPIRSIDGTTVTLGMGSSGATCVDQKYHGTTEAVTTYKRESINLKALGLAGQSVQDSGGSAGLITFSGGWDRTAMTTQSGETWLSNYATRGTGTLLTTNSKNSLRFDKLHFHLTQTGIDFATTSTDLWIGDIACSGVLNGISGVNNSRVKIDNYEFGIAYSFGIVQGLSSLSQDWNVKGGRLILPNAQTLTNCIGVALMQNAVWDFTELIGADYAFDCASIGQHVLKNARIRRSGRGSIGSAHGLRCFNVAMEDSTEVNIGTVYSMKHDQTVDTHKIFWVATGGTTIGVIQAATDQRHTASGIAWKFSPTDAAKVSQSSPMTLPVAKVAVGAGALVTVSLWMRRDSSSLNMQLRVPGGQIAGVASDVTASMSESANTWGGNGSAGALSLIFTPSEAGVVEIVVDVWGGATLNGWVDDLTVTQA